MNQTNLRIKRYVNYSENDWDLLLSSFDATINYTFWFLNYIEILNSNTKINNFTFVLYEKNKPIAIVPLYIEKINGKEQISMGQEPVFAPIFNSCLSNLNVFTYIKYIVKEIDKIAIAKNCTLARFIFSPLLNYNYSSKDYLKFGYEHNILYPNWYIFKSKKSFVLSLVDNKEKIFKKIRKGHRSNIKKTQKISKLIILDKDSYRDEVFYRYVDLYYNVKGNKRSMDAFKLDSLAIKSGLQFVMICELNDYFIGAIAFHIYNSKARYNSSVQLYNITQKVYPNHFLLWSGIDYLMNEGFELLEIGEQVDGSNQHSINMKDKNLSHFKSGWGGDLILNTKIQKEFEDV